MLLQFTVANYGSFDHKQSLNFRSTGLESINETVELNNVIETESGRILKIVGIYGANASGKSNLLKALSFFRDMVAQSMVAEEMADSGVNPFRQSANGRSQPSYFQVVLILSGKKYRYGFTLTSNGKIGAEWLFGPAAKNDTFYFKRDKGEITINSEWFPEGQTLPRESLRDNALFITFCSSFNGEISKRIRSYFLSGVSTDIAMRRRVGRLLIRNDAASLTNQLIEEGHEGMILSWLKEAGLVYQRIIVDDQDIRERVLLVKNVYDEDGKVIGETEMDLNQDESAGTQKFYRLIGRLHRKFTTGGLYIADEIDSNFHPSLLQKIIKLFQHPEINSAGAQLLFTSHDTNLMDPLIMRRDQFYFTEKNLCDSTRLYSLADLKGIRNNADFARQYLAGMYGALPILGNYLEEAPSNESLD